MKAHYSAWQISMTLPVIFQEIATGWNQRLPAGTSAKV
jgi:hypothetical protein